jgi:dTDP-glucose 4,6-dehydratase
VRKLTNILVTGGAGFIGCNFIHRLLQETPLFKGRIINLDALTYAGKRSNLADIEKEYSTGEKGRYVFVHGDICDRELA